MSQHGPHQPDPGPHLFDLAVQQVLAILENSGQQIKDLQIPTDVRERLRQTVLNQLGVADWIQEAIAAIARQDPNMKQARLAESPDLVANIHRSTVLSATQKQKATELIREFQRRLS
jgi:hypothetical protein